MQRIRGLIFAANNDSGSRSSERDRRAALTTAVTALARFAQVGSTLITVPLTLKYLGTERFGLWMTISSILAMANFADFGIGNGVLNTVAQAYGRDDIEGMRTAISSGFGVLTAIAVTLSLSFASIYPIINWPGFFRVTSPLARGEAGPALAVFAACFAANISIDIVQRAQLGLQQGYRYGIWQLAGTVLGLAGILIGIWSHAGLPMLIVAFAGAPVLTTAINAIHFFGFVRPDLQPNLQHVSSAAIAKIAKLGGLFFVLQVAVSISYSSDNVVLTRILGPIAVAQYAVPCKLFNLVTMVTAFIVMPLWPAYAEALERGDATWIRQTLGRSLMLVGAASIGLCVFLLIFGSSILRLWIGSAISVPFGLLAALSISSVLSALGSAISMFLNGISIVRFQIVIAIIGSTVNIVLSVLLTKRFGIPGVVYGTILSQLFIGIIPYAWYITRYLNRSIPTCADAL